jgi:hypothetical protein
MMSECLNSRKVIVLKGMTMGFTNDRSNLCNFVIYRKGYE